MEWRRPAARKALCWQPKEDGGDGADADIGQKRASEETYALLPKEKQVALRDCERLAFCVRSHRLFGAAADEDDDGGEEEDGEAELEELEMEADTQASLQHRNEVDASGGTANSGWSEPEGNAHVRILPRFVVEVGKAGLLEDA